jgi:uncharacterized protein (DUF1501 family)
MCFQILRRNFLKGLGAITAANTLPGLSLMNAYAQAAGDYKALVCVFLYGGNDGNNMVVPVQAAEYNVYAQGRGAGAGGLALAQASLVQVPQAGGARFGLHANLAPLQQVWANGDLALLLNTGPLVQPVTRAQYRANRSTRPANLFSHDDQQEQMQTAIPNNQANLGWGGRLGDRVLALNAGSTVPMNISVGGNDVFLKGETVPAYSVPAGGQFGLNGFNNSAQANARRNAMQQLFALDRQNEMVRSAADVIASAVNASTALNMVVNNSASLAAPAFQNLNTGLARQLFAVAKMVEGRTQLGLRRQIFFAQAGGYDNHQDQIADQGGRFSELGPALRAFYEAIVALGVQDQVTLFTLSDFGRTLRANDGGSDHAWGNHHLILGGAVQGGTTYGTFPNQALGGPDDTDSDGRWIPTTAIDQYAATLAKWFGVPDADIPAVVPNVTRFATRDLGFMA